MIQQQKVELIKESLIEMVHIIDYCLNYHKTDKEQWGANAGEGVLGYPSAIILFSAIDCMGSVFSGNNKFKVRIEGKERMINGTSEHINILNSKYFNLDLSKVDLSNIYNNIRSTLTHNSLMPSGYTLMTGENEKLPFMIGLGETNKRIYFVNLVPLFVVTKNAIETFIKDLDSGHIDFIASTLNKNIMKRDASMPMYSDPNKPGQVTIKIKEWIKR